MARFKLLGGQSFDGVNEFIFKSSNKTEDLSSGHVPAYGMRQNFQFGDENGFLWRMQRRWCDVLEARQQV